MRIKTTLCILAMLVKSYDSQACSCFGPTTFCETLNPPYEPPIDPAWWIPDNIVLGVKLATVEYGVDLKIVQDFSGEMEAGQIVRVWGDCGFLCRMYVTDVNDGDTVLWALRGCDLSGNGGCGLSLEEADDYQLSVCGVYWLNYTNGVISGPLYTEGATETIGIEDFAALVEGCLPTGVEEVADAEVNVRWTEGLVSITTPPSWADTKEVRFMDASGRVVHEARFRGAQGTIDLYQNSTTPSPLEREKG